MQLIIPMSGIGKRFREKGYKLPKPFIQISGKSIIEHVIEMFPGVEDILFIVNRDHYEDPELNLKEKLLRFAPTAQIAVIAPHKLGPAWAISQAKDFVKLDDPVVINYCDFACIWDFPAFREMLYSGLDGLIATYSGFHPHMLRSTQYAYLKMNQTENLVEIQEKLPFSSNPMKEPASSGTYGFGSGQILLDAIETQIVKNDSYKNEFYSSLTYRNMISSGKVIKKFEVDRFFQWGTPEDFEDFKWQKDFFTFKSKQNKRVLNATRLEILAAGVGKRFVHSGYSVAKPFLPLGKSFLVREAYESLGKPDGSVGILVQSDYEIPTDQASLLTEDHVVIRQVTGFTRGQAESAMISLASESKGSCVVGTCDSFIFPSSDLNLKYQKRTMGVWVYEPSDFAIANPNQFGWVELNPEGEIRRSWVKAAPDTDGKVYVITGTFFFSDDQEAVALIESFLQTTNLVNGEFYLDSLIVFAQKIGWKIFGLIPEWFVSLGTPEEYETYRYWESVFSSRPDLLVNDDE